MAGTVVPGKQTVPRSSPAKAGQPERFAYFGILRISWGGKKGATEPEEPRRNLTLDCVRAVATTIDHMVI
jgi:hypothetical protein